MVRFRRQALLTLQRQDPRQRPLVLETSLGRQPWQSLLRAVQGLTLQRNRGVNTPILLQQDPAECGAICLAIVLAFFQRPVARAELLKACGVSRNGADAAHLVTAARQFGFDAHGYRMGLERLKQIAPPAILFWTFNHFVVLEAIDDRRVQINDPARGRRELSIDDLDRDYTGIVITLEPDRSLRPSQRLDTPSAWLWQRISQHRHVWLDQCVFALVCALLIGGPSLLTRAPEQAVLWMIIFSVVAWILWIRIGLICRELQRHGDRRVERRLLELPLWAVEQQFAATFIEPLSSWSQISSNLRRCLLPAMPLIITGPIWAATQFQNNIGLGITLLTLLCAHAVLLFKEENHHSSYNNEHRILSARSGSLLHHDLKDPSTLKTMGLEADLLERWAALELTATRHEQRQGKHEPMLGWVLPSLRWSIPLLAIVLAPTSAQATLTGLALAASLQAQKLAIEAWINTRHAIERLQALEQLPKDPILDPANKRKQPLGPWQPSAVALDNVSFSHIPGGIPTIGPMDLTVQAGEYLLIEGPSGCGKSTLLRLMAGLLQADSGDIYIDGSSLKTYPPHQRRDLVMLIEDNAHFLQTTLRDYMNPWGLRAQHNQISHVLDLVGLGNIVQSLPEGLDTQLGEKDLRFSTSEIQLMGLARALLFNPRLLLLDEATSALDAKQEQKVIQLLREKKQTIVSVSHRGHQHNLADRLINLPHH